ncbi:uncharacterized protein CEXT_389351 [Caerostris extrusa]|uniref:Endonuclease/exonuclease/phosphatase domain-containing protein n=1 Tax=Caerostris extrusa TaxID=172846 RepID=A0AAV4PPR8_CAEEX|nr:uncharacterized protein CEXT_389351 [Caerostris extrusa]
MFFNKFKRSEIFAFCFPADYFGRSEVITDVLIFCPNIISVGLMDTSMSIHYIIESKRRFFEFKLRRCFWGVCYNKTIQWSMTAVSYIRSSTDIIRNAARACPLVEELAMQVVQKDSLKSLSRLSRLTFLSLSFNQCNGGYLSEFICLMGKIGQQIKHLSLEGFNGTFPVNDICKLSKPNLSSLSIDNKTIVIGDMNAHSTRWGYGDMNAAGKEIEDLLNSSLLDLIYDTSDPPTYIHYNGSGSTPDLLCVLI